MEPIEQRFICTVIHRTNPDEKREFPLCLQSGEEWKINSYIREILQEMDLDHKQYRFYGLVPTPPPAHRRPLQRLSSTPLGC